MDYAQAVLIVDHEGAFALTTAPYAQRRVELGLLVPTDNPTVFRLNVGPPQPLHPAKKGSR